MGEWGSAPDGGPVCPMWLVVVVRVALVRERRLTGLPVLVIAELVAEVGPVWQSRNEARLTARPRRRAVGAGARYRLVFADRLLVTLVHLRHGTTHDVLACWFGVHRRAIGKSAGWPRGGGGGGARGRGCLPGRQRPHGVDGRDRGPGPPPGGRLGWA